MKERHVGNAGATSRSKVDRNQTNENKQAKNQRQNTQTSPSQ